MNISDLMPTAEDLFGPKPFQPTSTEDYGDVSMGMEIAHRECARLIVNSCFFDPPLTEEEIEAYARRFGLTQREAETELRRSRNDA